MKELLPITACLFMLMCMTDATGTNSSTITTPNIGSIINDTCKNVSCYHGGSCVVNIKNEPMCLCPEDGDTVYGGDFCENKGTHLELSVNGIIGIAAGAGSFIILFLVLIIFGLVYRHKREMESRSKGANFMTMCEPAPGSKVNGGNFGEFNPAFNSMTQRSDTMHQPQFLPPGGDVPFGYTDPSREHHFARNSLHEPNDTLGVVPVNDLSIGVTRQHLQDDYSRSTRQQVQDEYTRSNRMTPRESQFVERNPDYHMLPTMRNEPAMNGYSRNSRNLDRQPGPDRNSGGYSNQDDSPTYIYRQSNRM